MVSLADDPEMKAIVVAEGIPGTYPAFKAIREKRPDILLFVNNTHEDPVQVSTVCRCSCKLRLSCKRIFNSKNSS